MTDSPYLGLGYLAPSQAQKHVTVNEAFRRLDALVQLGVLDRTRTAPPASPAEGDRHIVAAGATGAWAGRPQKIAAWLDGAWVFVDPKPGWLAYVAAEGALVAYVSGAWVSALGSLSSLDALTRLGVNATADAVNRLAVASQAVLFNHDGAGVQVKLNKASAGATASFLFQNGFSGRAEFGLVGSDAFTLKTSADGAAFVTAMTAAAGTGKVTLNAGLEATQIGAATAAAGRFTALAATGLFDLQQGGKIGGVTAAIRYAQFDDFGRITWRYDDNAYVQGPILHNFGLTGLGQGANLLSVNLGTGGAAVGPPAFVRVAATDSYADAAHASSKFQFSAVTAGAVGIGLEVATTGATAPKLTAGSGGVASDGAIQVTAAGSVIGANGHHRLRSYTVATLPAATTAGELIYVSNGAANKRLAVADGAAWRWPDGAVVS